MIDEESFTMRCCMILSGSNIMCDVFEPDEIFVCMSAGQKFMAVLVLTFANLVRVG